MRRRPTSPLPTTPTLRSDNLPFPILSAPSSVAWSNPTRGVRARSRRRTTACGGPRPGNRSQRARASHRHARFARWRVSRRWQKAGKRQLKSAYQVNSGIARAQGDFAAASTASRMYKDFFEELDARYLRANLRARARKRERLLSRARDRLVAQQRHGGETTAAEPGYDAGQAVLVKPELADEMSKEDLRPPSSIGQANRR